MMMKKRYISPATDTVQMYELESAILRDSFLMATPQVDRLRNMSAPGVDENETYLIEY